MTEGCTAYYRRAVSWLVACVLIFCGTAAHAHTHQHEDHHHGEHSVERAATHCELCELFAEPSKRLLPEPEVTLPLVAQFLQDANLSEIVFAFAINSSCLQARAPPVSLLISPQVQ